MQNLKLRDTYWYCEEMFEQDFHLQDILLVVAMGHSLPESKSGLASLSKDIIQNILTPAIEQSYWKSRSKIGLVTPTGNSESRCHVIVSSDSSTDQQFRRESFASPSLPKIGVVPFSLVNSRELRISSFLASRYAELVEDLQDDDQNFSLSAQLVVD